MHWPDSDKKWVQTALRSLLGALLVLVILGPICGAITYFSLRNLAPAPPNSTSDITSTPGSTSNGVAEEPTFTITPTAAKPTAVDLGLAVSGTSKPVTETPTPRPSPIPITPQPAAFIPTPEFVDCSGPGALVLDSNKLYGSNLIDLAMTATASASGGSGASGAPGGASGFLELPFPYDGGNENFGGTDAQFRRAVQRTSVGGRINSFFDHLYPIYPTQPEGSFGREPVESPVGDSILLFDGRRSGSDHYSGHPGYDFSVYEPRRATTPVFAAADGIVQEVGVHSSGAYFVKIRHIQPFGSFLTIYWHLNPDAFFEAMEGRVGETITAGERIATMGNTGWASGHHLHFEVRFDRNGNGSFDGSEVIDPFGFIPGSQYPSDPWGQVISFTDDRGDPYFSTGTQSQYLWKHALGATSIVPPPDQIPPTPTLVPGVDSHPPNIVCAPAGVVQPGSTVSWSWAPDPPPTESLAGVGVGCALTVRDPAGNPITLFDSPVRVELPLEVANLADVDVESLALYWQDEETENWQVLPSMVDPETGTIRANTDRTGHCAILGVPTSDIAAPRTRIEVQGPQQNGVFYDDVTVSLFPEDIGGGGQAPSVTRVEYSLDGGTTWQSYDGPFTLQPNGIPEPVTGDVEEGFGSLPGQFLVLASSADAAGNIEEPPAVRHVVINPSLSAPAPQGPGSYLVTVKTGCQPFSATDAKVYLVLHGELGSSQATLLDNPDVNDHEMCIENSYRIAVDNSLGALSHVEVWHDNTGPFAGWFLDAVSVEDESSHEQWRFSCGRWLADDQEDFAIKRIIYADGRCE